MTSRRAPAVASTPDRGRPCSVAAALDIIGDRWSILIVREIMFGNHRFAAIVRNTGAPRDRVAARLKQLVAAGVLERREYQQAPPRSEYHLTRAGRELGPVVQVLREWGDRWVSDRPPLLVRHHDHELSVGRRCDVCGEAVHARDVIRESDTPRWTLGGPVAAG